MRTIRQGPATFEAYSKALVKGAREAGLHSASLVELLKRLPQAEENKGLSILPVAAHQTTDNGEPAWVIVLRWEDREAAAKGNPLAHIRYFMFIQKTLKQTGFFTCG